MPRDFDLDFDDDLMRPRRQQAPRQSQGRPQQRPPQQRPQRDFGNTSSLDRMGNTSALPRTGSGRGHKKKNQTSSIIILIVEIVIFITLLVTFFVLKGKIADGDTGKKGDSKTEASEESGESSGGVNVESDKFSLTCTKVQLANDANGNPAALIYFTFVNKTDTPMSMDEVFPPSVVQNGVNCSTSAVLSEEPAEVANKNAQVSGGAAAECCYAVELQDFTSTLTLTIHDNYETFSDIGSTDIPLS